MRKAPFGLLRSQITKKTNHMGEEADNDRPPPSPISLPAPTTRLLLLLGGVRRDAPPLAGSRPFEESRIDQSTVMDRPISHDPTN